MKLDRVTITGADDTIKPGDMVALSDEFPYVEWGILFSANHIGKPRWPSNAWVTILQDYARTNKMNLSLHLCGKYVRDLMVGNPSFWQLYPVLWNVAQRVQLNFHADKHKGCVAFETVLRAFPKDYIFQMDGVNEETFFHLERQEGIRAFPLFDTSGGAGVLPKQWPVPIAEYCGYAGGLGPDNIVDQLVAITSKVGDARIWIDCETRVRSDDDRTFDLKRVRTFLEKAQPYVTINNGHHTCPTSPEN